MNTVLRIASIVGCLLAPLPALAKEAWVSVSDYEAPWCRYPTEKAWKEGGVESSARVVWRAGETTLALAWSSESGDWVVYDDYVLRDGGAVDLKRVYNTFYHGEVSLHETWVFDGTWRRTQRTLYGLTSKKPVTDDGSVTNPVGKYRSLQTFPFFALLGPETVSKKTCLPS